MTLCVQHFRMSAAAAAVRTWVARALERRRLGALLRAAATRVFLGLANPSPNPNPNPNPNSNPNLNPIPNPNPNPNSVP